MGVKRERGMKEREGTAKKKRSVIYKRDFSQSLQRVCIYVYVPFPTKRSDADNEKAFPTHRVLVAVYHYQVSSAALLPSERYSAM